MNTKTLMDKIESTKKLPSFEVSEEKNLRDEYSNEYRWGGTNFFSVIA